MVTHKNYSFKLLSFIFFVIIFSSCASRRDIIYLQNMGSIAANDDKKFETVLQPDDNLVITVTADEERLANPFNLMYINIKGTELRNLNNEALYTYLIDQNGEIDFPVLGKLKLAGLTRIAAESKIKDLIKPHINNAGVSVRVLNFKVSVLGEVNRPGLQSVVGDRITILEALSLAGDLTIYGARKEILLIREVDGVKTMANIDITQADIVNSPYYYLAHNDVIYVKPNKTKVNSSVVGPNITVAISAVSLIITIIALSTR